MTKSDLFQLFSIDDIMDLPAAVRGVIFGEIGNRNDIYRRLIELNNFEMGRDWFQDVYQEELAQRGQKKQDFTPNELSVLCSLLTGTKGNVYEPTAGNGSMLIADWNERCKRMLPWQHFPSQHMFTCWELSDRAIPILLLNLSIRGMMGYVYHGDVLEQELKCKYILLNRNDDTLGFSEIIKDENNALKIVSNEINRNSERVETK